MTVIAFITKTEDIESVTAWAAHFAQAGQQKLCVVCWAYAPANSGSLSEDSTAAINLSALMDATHAAIDDLFDRFGDDLAMNPLNIELRRVGSTDATASVIQEVHRESAELIVAATVDKSGRRGATYPSNSLLRQAPCNTVILYQSPKPRRRFKKILFVATDSPHDRTAATLTSRMASAREAEVTIATIEEDEGLESVEVGRRELRELLRDAGVDPDQNYDALVFKTDESFHDIVESADKHDLVFVAANNQPMVERLVSQTKRATVAVVKRAPPLRSLALSRQEWIPRLSPADYADLVQGLRRGSRFSVDFMMMLGLAAAIASLGLLQDSPAVVIGSMLLAPLMTPMVGSGLALAQANRRLAITSLKTIGAGFLLTLAVSVLIALVTPGKELTPQVVARVNPNLLDLLIALFSAAAAAYAMARPNLLGAMAGVAIATALVPPLCSSGVCFAYGQFALGLGASLLFVTNLVAIVLAASITFRVMGVTSRGGKEAERRWVYRSLAVLATIVVALAFPLEMALREQIDRGKPQPLGFPLTRELVNALHERVQQDPGVEIMLAARPSVVEHEYDVVIYLASEKPLPRSYQHDLTEIVRHHHSNPDAKVAILCLQQAWLEPEGDVSVD